MSKRQIVQNPLTTNEIFELGEAIFQSVPRSLDAEKVRADLFHKKGLARDLGVFFRDRYAAQSNLVDVASWADFYRRIFGKEVNLASLHIPAKPAYECWPIVIVPGLITNNDAFDACKKMLGGAWRYTNDLNTVRDIVERPQGAYVVWVKALVEADPDLANISAEAIAARKLDTITLLERLVLELKHFDETKQHLDVENWTLCAGSRYSDGGVPGVYWGPDGRELHVDWGHVDDGDPHLRVRAAVC